MKASRFKDSQILSILKQIAQQLDARRPTRPLAQTLAVIEFVDSKVLQ